ncbi:AI-2E family transporter [Elioraea sp.]|uniref:AI-2E family transporter n=1 Tax=Elioraea sp. TaxID=2185103 RepID=UPI0025BF01EF|nr:AI-2E family transporter [Elioraea sp.]
MITVGILLAVLYVGQAVFVPLALALLLSVALLPPASWLERQGLPRIAAVLVVLLLALAAIGGVLLLVVSQAITLAENLPAYEASLRERLRAVSDGSGVLDRAAQTLGRLAEELSSPPPTAPTQVVTVASDSGGSLAALLDFATWLAAPAASLAVALLFMTFLLLQREDVRDRVLRLAGLQDLPRTTLAMTDATARVGRYLLMHASVNAFFGTAMGLGLWAVGIPNAPLWGVLAFVLRFVPFIGVWLFLCFPVAIAVLTSEGWVTVLLVLAVFVVVDIIATYALEPWLYGSSAGITPLALLLSSATWTVLWGPVGLILAPAITACLVIIGRHVPALGFLDVLLGTGEALPAPTRFYQRLLADDIAGARAIAEAHAAREGQLAALSDLAVPAIAAVARDRREQRVSEREVARLAAAIAGSVRTLCPAVGAPGVAAENAARPVALIPVAGPLDAAAAAIVGTALRCSGRAVASGIEGGEDAPALALLCAAGRTGRRIARALALGQRSGAAVALVTLSGEGPASLPNGLGRHFAGLGPMLTALGGVTAPTDPRHPDPGPPHPTQPGARRGVETARTVTEIVS